MKFGAHCYLWIERWSDDTLYLLDRARALELDFLELGVGDDVRFDAARTGQRARDLGLKLAVSPGGAWPLECDVSLRDAADRARGQAWHRRMVDTAAELHAVAYTGALYGHPGNAERRLPTEDEYRWAAEELHELAAYAAARRVRLALEPMSHFRTHLVNRPEQVVRLVDMVAHPNVGVLLDTYHLVPEIRDFAEAIRVVGERLWGLHACENDRGVPGGGIVPWAAIAEALREIGFDGYVGLEAYNTAYAPTRGLYGDPCSDGDEFVRRGTAFLRGQFG